MNMSKPKIDQRRAALAIAGALVLMSVVPGCDRAQEDRAASAASEAVHNANQALKSAGEVAREGAREAGRALGDAGISTKIKTALLADKSVNGADINVDTNGGKVTLTGNLPDQAQADRALKIARGVEGVKAIENRLTVGTGAAASRS
jgi:hyperosmotically inducible protein